MKKNLFIAGALIIILATGYFILESKGRKAQNFSRKVRIGYNAESITNASIIIAHEKGFFKNRGIDAEILPLKSGKEVRLAMTAEQIDIGAGGFPNFMSAIAKGAPIKLITDSASSPVYIFVRPDEDIKKFTDLYGKIVSASASGTNGLFFRAAMEEENIDISKMIFTDTERTYQTIALAEKKSIDAIVVSEQDTKMFLEAGTVVLSEWEKSDYIQDFVPRNSIAINTDFLSQHEDIASDFLDACIDAHRLINGNPLEAAQILADHIKEQTKGAVNHSPEQLAQQWKNKETINMVWQDPAITMELVKKAKEIGELERDLAVNDVYDLRFQERLQAAQIEIYGEPR